MTKDSATPDNSAASYVCARQVVQGCSATSEVLEYIHNSLDVDPSSQIALAVLKCCKDSAAAQRTRILVLITSLDAFRDRDAFVDDAIAILQQVQATLERQTQDDSGAVGSPEDLFDAFMEALRTSIDSLRELSKLGQRIVQANSTKRIAEKPHLPPSTTESFRFLVLGDLHLGMSKQKWLWPNIEQQFFDDLKVVTESCGPIDAILFVGDLAFSGRGSEFEQFDVILNRLKNCLRDLGSEPTFFCVPGNHDVERPTRRSARNIVKLIRRWDEIPEVEEDFWQLGNSTYRRVVERSFLNYQKWWEANAISDTVTKGMLPGDFSATILKGDKRVGIVGLNSSFRQLAGGDYFGRLSLNEQQFHEACGGDGAKWSKNNNISILMTHHPPEWLCKDAQDCLDREIYLPGRFAMHAYGHMHEPEVRRVSFQASLPRCFLQCHSLFGMENWQGEVTRAHGYLAVEIKLSSTDARLRLWPRRAVSNPGWRLIPDHQSFVGLREDGGTRPFEIAANI